MARKLWIFCFSVFVLSLDFVTAHSQMKCAKYNVNDGSCAAPIRNQNVAFEQEAYQPSVGDQGICQTRWANPITAFYSNGALCPDYAGCPNPMGSYTPGESFTVMWWARNHAVDNQNPDTVFLYLSPKESATSGSETPESTFLGNQICSGPYANCNGQNGDTVPCTLSCKMPSNLASGIYTLYWKWPWQGTVYTTCADINVVSSSGSGSGSGSSSSSSSSSSRATTAKVTTKAMTTSRANAAVTTGKVNAVTTGRVNPVTTSKANPVTTSKAGSTSSTSGSTSGSAMCYLPGTPNVNGTILSNPPYCGKNARKARCADGQCCSKYGYCGPIPDSNGNYYEEVDGQYQQVSYQVASNLYCSRNQGDYRKVPCSQINNKDDASVTDAGVSIKFNLALLLSSIAFVAFWNRFSL